MKAVVIYAENPFAPADRRRREVRRAMPLSRLAPRSRRPVIAVLNGQPVMRRNRGWHRTRLKDGDQLAFVTLPLSGGGGGSNPLRAILTLALMAFAGPLAGTILGTTAAAAAAAGGMAAFTFSATQMGIVLAGSALMNALLPVKHVQAQSPSPTYTLAAQGNTARIDEVIPVQYGRVLSYPDFAASPYWEYAGQEQYLYQLLCLGLGTYDVAQIRIEDTDISAFEEITYEVVPPGSNVTLFPTAVITSVEVSGQEMRPMVTGTWTRSGTTATITRTAHGFASGDAIWLNFTTGGATSGPYAVATVPTADTFTVTVPAAGTSGNVEIRRIVGGLTGFVASGPGQVANRLAVDLVLPVGLYSQTGGGDLDPYQVDFTFEAQPVDDAGSPTGAWITLETASISARTVTPQRYSHSFTLATPGRYRVRAYRRDVDPANTNIGSTLLWAGLRAYMAEVQDFGPVTLIAMKMRATNNLSLQASRKVNVLATRKLPVWNGSAWSDPVATRSPAWAIADAARNTDYGAGLADSKIDLAALLALDAVWQARGDFFDYRFDQAQGFWDAVQAIALVGRAKCYMQAGMLRTVRDDAQTVPVVAYSMRSIKEGSFSVDYIMPSETMADAVDASYFDAATWTQRKVRAALPGSTAARPIRMTFPGMTGRAHVLREGMYHAAVNKYRRRAIRFNTEMDGFIPAFGDLIAVQHDMAGWGLQAEVTGWDASGRILTLSEPVTVSGTTVIALRRADGSVWGPVAITAGALANQVILASSPDFVPEADGQTRERTHAMIGTASTWSTLAKVTHVTPAGTHDVMIEAVAEDPSVHTAETGVTAPPLRTSMLPTREVRPRVGGLFARRKPGSTTLVLIGWRPAPNADGYQVEMAAGSDVADPAAVWTRITDTTAAHTMAELLHAKRTMIRVRGVGLATGPWIASTLGDLLPSFWNTDDTPFWTGDSNPFWSV